MRKFNRRIVFKDYYEGMRKFNRRIAFKDYYEGRGKEFLILLIPFTWIFLPFIIADELCNLISLFMSSKVHYTYGYCTIDHYEEGMRKEKQKFLEELNKYGTL